MRPRSLTLARHATPPVALKPISRPEKVSGHFATQRTMVTTPSSSEPRKLKILMLHGFTQSGPLFHAKTRALEKNLEKQFPPAPKYGHLPMYPGGVQLSYPTAPIHLPAPDIPGFDVDGASATDKDDTDAWAWWRRKGDREPYRYEGMELGFEKIAQILREQGPFDGVVGFSQGAAASGMVASLLEPGRREAFEKAQSKGGMRYPESFEEDTGYVTDVIHPPMKFAVSYSGFGASTNPLYQAFYEPKIATPMLHFIGSVDTVVEEARSLRLVDACACSKEERERRVVYHPGGHFLPSSQKQYVAALVGFIREAVGGNEAGKKEEKAEDMDMPF
ncbi:serine hydrolase-domain-containing protein [Cryomyces antarcticus]